MNRIFLLVRFGIIALCALLPAILARWAVLRLSGDGGAALLISAFLFVVGGLLGWEIANRFAPAITDRILGRSDRR